MNITLPTRAETLPKPKPAPHPREGELTLRNEAGLHRKNPPWQLVEQVIRELDTGNGNSFCILATPGNNYIQTLHGFNGYHLERRISVSNLVYTHYRACYPGASPGDIELEKHDSVNSGEHRDLLLVEEVIDGFRAFYRGEAMPVWLDWRILDI